MSSGRPIALRFMVPILLIGLLVPLPLGAAVAKITIDLIPMPEDDKPKPLKKLFRGAVLQGSREELERRSVAEINSIRLKEMPDLEEDPVKPVWILTGGNTRPAIQKAIVKIRLLDDKKQEVGVTRGIIILNEGTKNKEFKIKMKIEREEWERAKHVQIEVRWQHG